MLIKPLRVILNIRLAGDLRDIASLVATATSEAPVIMGIINEITQKVLQERCACTDILLQTERTK